MSEQAVYESLHALLPWKRTVVKSGLSQRIVPHVCRFPSPINNEIRELIRIHKCYILANIVAKTK